MSRPADPSGSGEPVPAPTIKAGDSVFHRPTGETWYVLKVEDRYVYPGGWPPSRGLLSDCELVERGPWLSVEPAASVVEPVPPEAPKPPKRFVSGKQIMEHYGAVSGNQPSGLGEPSREPTLEDDLLATIKAARSCAYHNDREGTLRILDAALSPHNRRLSSPEAPR